MKIESELPKKSKKPKVLAIVGTVIAINIAVIVLLFCILNPYPAARRKALKQMEKAYGEEFTFVRYEDYGGSVYPEFHPFGTYLYVVKCEDLGDEEIRVNYVDGKLTDDYLSCKYASMTDRYYEDLLSSYFPGYKLDFDNSARHSLKTKKLTFKKYIKAINNDFLHVDIYVDDDLTIDMMEDALERMHEDGLDMTIMFEGTDGKHAYFNIGYQKGKAVNVTTFPAYDEVHGD